MDYFFKIEGNIVPKARPRFGQGRSYLPKRYRDWKNNAIALLQEQLPSNFEAIKKCSISVALYGSHRGDIDNLFGAIADALVQATIIIDDRLSVVTNISIQHIPDKKRKFAEIEVRELSARS